MADFKAGLAGAVLAVAEVVVLVEIGTRWGLVAYAAAFATFGAVVIRIVLQRDRGR